MEIAEVIRPEHVGVGLKAADKGQLIEALGRQAAAATGLDVAAVTGALAARERLGSTGLGRGFALPHARLAGLDRFFAAFVRLAKPIEYDAIDGKPVDLVCLLLMPAAAGNEHLAALAAISRPMRDAEFVSRLRRAGSAAALGEVLLHAGGS